MLATKNTGVTTSRQSDGAHIRDNNWITVGDDRCRSRLSSFLSLSLSRFFCFSFFSLCGSPAFSIKTTSAGVFQRSDTRPPQFRFREKNNKNGRIAGRSEARGTCGRQYSTFLLNSLSEGPRPQSGHCPSTGNQVNFCVARKEIIYCIRYAGDDVFGWRTPAERTVYRDSAGWNRPSCGTRKIRCPTFTERISRSLMVIDRSEVKKKKKKTLSEVCEIWFRVWFKARSTFK